MLPKQNRLNLKTDFKWVASGKKVDTKFLTLFIRMGDNEVSKVGIANSSKVFKKAHDRNRARRITASVFEVLYAKLPNNVNIVALPKAGIVEVKSVMVLLDLEESLKNAKIID